MNMKYINRVYVFLGLMLILELAILFINSGVVPGINPRVDKLKEYAKADIDNKTILPGDIFDRNGEVIVKTEKEEIVEKGEDGKERIRSVTRTTYSDGKAFSPVVGYAGERKLSSPTDDSEKIVGERKGSRLMSFVDEEDWEGNGLYSTVDADGTKGQSITTTLDAKLQLEVYRVLSSKMSSDKSIGSAIVMDAKTGEILSMVSFPTYDYNDLENAKKKMEYDGEHTSLEPKFPVSHKNPKAPGSIFKVLMAVSLIDHGEENFKVNNTSFTVEGWKCEARKYETSTLKVGIDETIGLETALNVSSNVYFAQAALKLGKKNIAETAEKFMLSQDESEIRLDFGDVPYSWDLNISNDVLAQTGFGQGKTGITTVYAAMITQAIANDGKMMKPYLIKNLFNTKNKVVYEGEEKLLSEATSKSTANKVARAMRTTAIECCNLHNLMEVKSVFDKYEVAGKTGTAEVGDKKNMTNNAWYISFAPVNDPKYVVVVNECKTRKAGYAMMPAVADIYKYLFEKYTN